MREELTASLYPGEEEFRRREAEVRRGKVEL